VAELKALSTRIEMETAEANASTTRLHQVAPTHPYIPPGSLPKARDPHVFKGVDKGDYDQWARDLNRLFTRFTVAYPTGPDQCDYASQWLGKSQQDIWERNVRIIGPELVTWEVMKSIMLNSMGSPEERVQHAFDKLKKVKQGKFTPTETLNYMKTYWDEIGDVGQRTMIHDFIAALNPDVRDRVELSETPCTSLVEAEDRATRADRYLKEHGGKRTAEDGPSRTHVGTKRQKGTQKATYEVSGEKGGEVLKPQAKGDPPTCYGCRKVGHKKPDCPEKHLWEGKAIPTTRNLHK